MVSSDLEAATAAVSGKILATWLAPPASSSRTVGQPPGSTHGPPLADRRSSMMAPLLPDWMEVTSAARAALVQAAGSTAVVAGNAGGAAETLSALIWLVRVGLA